jgi:hypothetical protein
MDKPDLLDKALEMIMGDLDDVEGSSVMSHSADECPDPLTCSAHDSELGSALAPGDKEPEGVKIEVKKIGMPSMEGDKAEEPSIDDKGEHGEELDAEDVEALKKLLRS